MAGLTKHEELSERYITAYHELSRLQRKWTSGRVGRIASDLNLDTEILRLTWCLLHAVRRTRQRSPAVNLSLRDAYLSTLGIRLPFPRPGRTLQGAGVRQARDNLLAAGWRGDVRRRRVLALLSGREMELDMREDAEYEDDVEISDDDEITAGGSICKGELDAERSLSADCLKAVRQLPDVERLPHEIVHEVARHVAAVAAELKQVPAFPPTNCLSWKPDGKLVEKFSVPSRNARRMARYRTEAMRWLATTDNPRRTARRKRRMAEAVAGIAKAARVRLHPVAERAVCEAFYEEEALAEGGLRAFGALVGGGLGRLQMGVRERETERLLGAMKTPDGEIAGRAIAAFGSARRALRAGEAELAGAFGGEADGVLRCVHGRDEALFAALKGRVRLPWLVCRVVGDKLGGLEGARRMRFGAFVSGEGEAVRLTTDERLQAYEAVGGGARGVARERFEASWELLRAVCWHTRATDAVAVTAQLLDEEADGIDVLRRLVERESVESVCVRAGLSADEAIRLKIFAAGFVPSVFEV